MSKCMSNYLWYPEFKFYNGKVDGIIISPSMHLVMLYVAAIKYSITRHTHERRFASCTSACSISASCIDNTRTKQLRHVTPLG